MITSCIVSSRAAARAIKTSLEENGSKVCWITISGLKTPGLVARSNKHILTMFFDDITSPIYGITSKQAKKIKDFIMNHHLNSPENWCCLINCIAGQSRSVAVGMFLQNNLGIETKFIESQHPNKLVLSRLKVKNP